MNKQVRGPIEGPPDDLDRDIDEARRIAQECWDRGLWAGWLASSCVLLGWRIGRALMPSAQVRGPVEGPPGWPSVTDSIAVDPGDPPGWHVREATEAGYPLMGSSPAERAECVSRGMRIQIQAMRDHEFEGGGQYCEHWSSPSTSGGPETGWVTMRARCGYGRDTHPEQEPETVMEAGEGLLC